MNSLLNIGLYHYLIVGLLLFIIGFLGIIISKNIIKILISFEILVCGISVNFAAFSVYSDVAHFKGAVFAIFIMVLTLLHISVCLAVIIEAYKVNQSSDIEDFGELKG